MTARCLYCYQPLQSDEQDFHAQCSKKIFGQTQPPLFPYGENQLELLATEVLKSQITIPGVQPKLSLHITSDEKDGLTKRFTIVGLWGNYILKPPTQNYHQLPEVEDLTMHLAEIAKIKVVQHSLIRMQSGNLAYITKRIDRVKSKKLAMEDMCQLTERLTENKYLGSYEQVAKTIQKYATNPGLGVVNFFELVLFCWITGNADMHLKNFSLIKLPGIGMTFSPAYDLVATALVNPDDKEELALTLNAKKRKIKKTDFITAFNTLKLDEKQQINIFNKMIKSQQAWMDRIKISFLSQDLKDKYIRLIAERIQTIL